MRPVVVVSPFRKMRRVLIKKDIKLINRCLRCGYRRRPIHADMIPKRGQMVGVSPFQRRRLHNRCLRCGYRRRPIHADMIPKRGQMVGVSPFQRRRLHRERIHATEFSCPTSRVIVGVSVTDPYGPKKSKQLIY